MILVFLLLWFLHLKYVAPLEEEGIEITFGEIEEGGGVPEISKTDYTPKVHVTQPAPPVRSKPSPNDLMVQEKDESLAVNKPTETPEPDVDPELIRQQQEREEKARQERERQEQKKREEEAKRAKAADAAKGLLGGGNSTDGADGDGKSSGSDSKGDKSGENPIIANPPGVNVNVRGRTCLKCVKPAGKFTIEGKVVMRITVDEQGNVVAGVDAGTTISDQKVLQAAKVAAMNSKFSPGEIANGTITYIFK